MGGGFGCRPFVWAEIGVGFPNSRKFVSLRLIPY
jgi:hypothetical protein